MLSKLPIATFVMYFSQADMWLIYYVKLGIWYHKTVMLVAEYCQKGCDIPHIAGQL